MHGSKISDLNLKGLLFRCASLYENQYYNNAGKIAAFAPKLQRIKYGSNAGRKKNCACPAN